MYKVNIMISTNLNDLEANFCQIVLGRMVVTQSKLVFYSHRS